MIKTQKEIKRQYYTDKPENGVLPEILDLVKDFADNSANNLLLALSMKNYNLDDVERLTDFINRAIEKMRKENSRIHKRKESFNEEYATDYNNYFHESDGKLMAIRSSLSAITHLLRRLCPTRHPSSHDCRKYNIKPKSVFTNCMLRKPPYVGDFFGIDSCPDQVRWLLNSLLEFFVLVENSAKACIEANNTEKATKKDYNKCKYILKNHLCKIEKNFANVAQYIPKNTIEAMKVSNPFYQKMKENYHAAVQSELHEHNVAVLEHYCLITMNEIMTDSDMTPEDIKLFRNDAEHYNNCKYVAQHFDEFLPENINKKGTGLYICYYLMWANVQPWSHMVQFLHKNYKGSKELSQYRAAQNLIETYDKNSQGAIKFNTTANNLINIQYKIEKKQQKN